MPLWTDYDFISQADLVSIDPDLTGLIKAQSLTLTGATGLLRRGIQDAGAYLESRLTTFGGYCTPPGSGLSQNHLAAVGYMGGNPTQSVRAMLNQVVVSGINQDYWSNVKMWVANRVLITIYLAAANKDENDRYEEKLKQYRRRDEFELFPMFQRSGLPTIARPMPCPAAAQAVNSGTWSVALTAGAGTLTQDWDVAITYADSSFYVDAAHKGNAESAPSAVKQIALTNGNVLAVDISDLNPPTGEIERALLARGYLNNLAATHWNVYAGLRGQTLYLQNSSPIPIATKTYTFAADPVTNLGRADQGQYADSFQVIPNLTIRG